jgi:hypothetical protein
MKDRATLSTLAQQETTLDRVHLDMSLRIDSQDHDRFVDRFSMGIKGDLTADALEGLGTVKL